MYKWRREGLEDMSTQVQRLRPPTKEAVDDDKDLQNDIVAVRIHLVALLQAKPRDVKIESNSLRATWAKLTEASAVEPQDVVDSKNRPLHLGNFAGALLKERARQWLYKPKLLAYESASTIRTSWLKLYETDDPSFDPEWNAYGEDVPIQHKDVGNRDATTHNTARHTALKSFVKGYQRLSSGGFVAKATGRREMRNLCKLLRHGFLTPGEPSADQLSDEADWLATDDDEDFDDDQNDSAHGATAASERADIPPTSQKRAQSPRPPGSPLDARPDVASQGEQSEGTSPIA